MTLLYWGWDLIEGLSRSVKKRINLFIIAISVTCLIFCNRTLM